MDLLVVLSDNTEDTLVEYMFAGTAVEVILDSF
jgi:hypothetical protein